MKNLKNLARLLLLGVLLSFTIVVSVSDAEERDEKAPEFFENIEISEDNEELLDGEENINNEEVENELNLEENGMESVETEILVVREENQDESDLEKEDVVSEQDNIVEDDNEDKIQYSSSVAKLNEEGNEVNVEFDLNGWYWTEDKNDSSSKIVTFLPDSNHLVWSTDWRTPSRVDNCEEGGEMKKCMFEGWYLESWDAVNQVTKWTWYVLNDMIVYAKWLPFEDKVITFTNGLKIVIMDRNLWAKASWTWCSSTDVATCGNYFQWWNNYWFSTNNEKSDSATVPQEKWINHVSTYYVAVRKTIAAWNVWGGVNDELWWWWSVLNPDSMKQWPCPGWYHIANAKEWSKVGNLLWSSSANILVEAFALPYWWGTDTVTRAINRSTESRYWISTATSAGNANLLHFNKWGSVNWTASEPRYLWRTIRCFKDEDEGLYDIEYQLNWWIIPESSVKPLVTVRWWETETALPLPTNDDSSVFLWWYTTPDFKRNTKVETNAISYSKIPDPDSGKIVLYAKWGDFQWQKDVTYVYGWPWGITFNGTQYIDTDLKLFSANDFLYKRDFKISFKLDSLEKLAGQQENFNTIISMMDESASPWPWIVFRYNTNSNQYQMIANVNSSRKKQSDFASVQSGIDVSRTWDFLYYNGEQFQDYSDFVSTFNVSLTIWSSLNGSLIPFRFFKWKLSDFEVTVTYFEGFDGDEVPLPEPSWSWYTFQWWYKDPSFRYPFDWKGVSTGESIKVWAKWDEIQPETFVVSFVDDNGENLQEPMEYTYKTSAEFVEEPEVPEKQDVQYIYTFTWWDKEISEVIEDVTYTATYSKTLRDYTVTFMNTGDVVLQSEQLLYWTIPEYKWEIPTRDADMKYTYTFAWWFDGENIYGSGDTLPEVGGNVIYTAVYSPVYIDYMVTWVDYDEAVLSWAVYHYGDRVEMLENPTRESDGAYTYVFQWWEPSVSELVEWDMIYIAKYDAISIGSKYSGRWRIKREDENQTHNSAEQEQIEGKTDDIWDDVIITQRDISTYAEEVIDAYKWAYENDITTLKILEWANPNDDMIRWYMAKVVVNYAVNVLWEERPEALPWYCNWMDKEDDWGSAEIKFYAKNACALWIMWINMKEFMPNKKVTRAEFWTIVSRLLWWDKYDVKNATKKNPYYIKHLEALRRNGIITQIENPTKRIEKRKWVWVVLKRTLNI